MKKLTRITPPRSYEAPDIVAMSVEAEQCFALSLNYGDEGEAGNDPNLWYENEWL